MLSFISISFFFVFLINLSFVDDSTDILPVEDRLWELELQILGLIPLARDVAGASGPGPFTAIT